MGDIIRSIVRKDVKLAVYDEIRISVKNHQIPLTIRVDPARGPISQPVPHYAYAAAAGAINK